MFLRRLVMVLAIVFAGSLALAAAAVAAGGLGPGKYTFNSSSANAFFGMGKKGGPPSPSWSVSVNHGLNSFKPKAGARTVNNGTMVYVTEWDATGNGGFGCFVVPDSDFTVARDLSSASLHATLTTDEACPGFATAVGGSKAAFAGGNSGLTLPMTVDVTWSATGAVTTYDDAFSLQCLSYNESGSSSNRSTGAAATGTISVLSGQFTGEFADVTTTTGKLDIKGVPPSGCFGY